MASLPILLSLIALVFGLYDGTCYVSTSQDPLSCNKITNVCSNVSACIQYLDQNYFDYNKTSEYSRFTIILVNSTTCADVLPLCMIGNGTSWTILGADPSQRLCCSMLRTDKRQFRSLTLENLILPPINTTDPYIWLGGGPPMKLLLRNITVQGVNQTRDLLVQGSPGSICGVEITKSTFSNLRSVFGAFSFTLANTASVSISQSTFEDNKYSLALFGSNEDLTRPNGTSLVVQNSKFLRSGALILFHVRAYFENVEFIGLTNSNENETAIIHLEFSNFDSVGCKFTKNVVRSHPPWAQGAIIYGARSEISLDEGTVFSNNEIHTNATKDRCGCLSVWETSITSFAEFTTNIGTDGCSPGIASDINEGKLFFFGGTYKTNIGAPLLHFFRNDPLTLTFDSRGAIFENNECGDFQKTTGCELSVGDRVTKKATDVAGIATDCANVCGKKNAACLLSKKGNVCIVGSNSNLLCDSDGVCVENWLNVKVKGLQVQWWLAVGGSIIFVLVVLFFSFGWGCASCRNKKASREYDGNLTPLLDDQR